MSLSPAADPASSRADARGRWAVLGALLAATFLKLWWACSSGGSVDAMSFFNFAYGVQKLGLCGFYAFEPTFNHTPLTGGFIVLLFRLAHGDFLTFSTLLRVLPIVADAAVVIGLLRWRDRLGNPPWWALTLFAASPVSIMVSGFHGNVDPIMVALLFYAAVAAALERPLTCGVLFALACNVKIVPIVFGPVFFFYWLARGQGWRFLWPTVTLILAGSAWPLIMSPQPYLRNVFGYGGIWGLWGIPYLLRKTGWEAVERIHYLHLNAIQTGIGAALKYSALAGMAFLGWNRRAAGSIFVTLGGAWLIFFVLAPGFGVQYLVWFAPFVLLLTPRGYAALTASSTVLMAVFYHVASGRRFPWFLAIPNSSQVETWSVVALLPWLTFVVVLWVVAARWWKLPAGEKDWAIGRAAGPEAC